MAVTDSPQYPVYSLRGLSCGYGGKNVLTSIDWLLEPGDCFGILGPGGEGKSLLLKALSGLIPYTGSLSFQGQELNRMNALQKRDFRLKLGMTFQKDGLFDSLSCAENLRFPLLERLVLTPKEREKKIEKALEDVGLKGQGGLWVHEMSGGMQKRLGIARALLFSPQVLLYDEPAAGLDPITTRAINDLIIRMRDQYAMSVVLVTSDLSQAQQICSRMGLLWKGRFEQTGTPAALRGSKNPAVHQFFNGLPEGPLTEAVA